MSAMSIEKRRKMGYNKNEYLTKEELALYHFRWDGQGTIIDPIKIDHTGRVPALPGMADVIDSLYGEEAKLIELSSLDSSKSS
jgi:predicted ATPase